MVTVRNPSDMTTCLPWREIWNPALGSARMASRWLTPGYFGMLRRHLDFPDLGPGELVLHGVEELADRVGDVLEGVLFGLSLRTAAGQTRDPDAIPLFGS